MSYIPDNFQPHDGGMSAIPKAPHRIKPPKPDTRPAWRKKLDDDIGFGIEQTIFCFVTDFIDPFVGGRVQNMYDAWGKLNANPADANLSKWEKFKKSWVQSRKKNVELQEKKDTVALYLEKKIYEEEKPKKSAFRQAFEGEVGGDLTAIIGFVAMRQWLPQPIEWAKNAFHYLGDKKLEKHAKKELKNWAFKKQFAEDSPEYRAEVEKWKDNAAEDMAKSTAMSVWSTVNNVAFQRFFSENDRPVKVILSSKGIGAAITWGTMVGMRFLMPKTMHEMDEELSNRYIAPTVNFVTGKRNNRHVDAEHALGTEEKGPMIDSSVAQVKDATTERLRPPPAVVASQAGV